MEIIVKRVDINSKYYVKITYGENSIHRFYTLRDTKEDKVKCESYNRDSFLLKAKQYVKINSKLENLIASY